MSLNIENERWKKQMSKEAIAKELGITSQTYRGYINGKPIPSDKLLKMSRLFGCSLDYLMGRNSDNDGKAC